MNYEREIAVVTGANRGLGLETVRRLAASGRKVVLTSRDPAAGAEAARGLEQQGLQVVNHQLDVTDADSIAALQAMLSAQFSRLDVLVNNAGVMLERHDPQRPGAATALAGDLGLVRRTLEVNLLGAIAVSQALVPLMGGRGRVVNVSSGLGQLADMQGGWPGYRSSKAALNAYTRMLAAELADSSVKVNAVCPGWVRTGMGGPDAPRSVEEGADTIMWAATLADDGPSGGFFRDRRPIDW